MEMKCFALSISKYTQFSIEKSVRRVLCAVRMYVLFFNSSCYAFVCGYVNCFLHSIFKQIEYILWLALHFMFYFFPMDLLY